MTIFANKRILAVAALACLMQTGAALAGSSCRVLDPELQNSYQGSCNARGLADGHGIATGNVATYQGRFKDGMKDGPGTKIWTQTGDKYEGQWHADFREGFGLYAWGGKSQWPGQYYQGQFVQDLRDGQGTFVWPNGDRFTGIWKKDHRYGLTTMETHRQESEKLHREALSAVGKTVCHVANVGIGNQMLIHGVLSSVSEHQINVELDEQSAGLGIYPQRTIEISADVTGWVPCDL